MKQGRTLSALATELERQSHTKRDFLTRADALHVSSNGHTDLHVPALEPLVVNDVAHGHFAEYLNVPKGFYDFLRSRTEKLRITVPLPAARPEGGFVEPSQLLLYEEQPLFDVMLNRLLKDKVGEQRLVRTLDGRARAFLSQSFSLDLDNYDVYMVAVRAMEEIGLCPQDVKSCEVTETRLYLKVVSPRLTGEVKVGDAVQAGFVLTNSEVGAGSLSIRQFLLRLVCDNGAVVEDAYKARHVGRKLEADSNGVVYKSDTRQAEAKLRLLTMRDHIQATLDEHRFAQTLARMQETAMVKLEGSIEKVVEVTARKFGLHEDERTRVLHHLIEGADLSLWGLSNAITATARHIPNYDRATEVESIGGKFLSLPAGEVKEIVRAA